MLKPAGRPFLLALVLLAAACLQPPRTAAAIVRESPLRDLPQQSVGLLVLEVASLRDRRPVAAWLSDLATRAEREGALQALMERFGKQIVSQLDRVALAAVPQPDEQFGFALLAEGEFDEATLREALGGVEILTVLEVADRPDLSVTVLPGGTLGLGPRALLEDIRRNAAGSLPGLASNRSLMTLLERIESTAQVWGAMDYAPMARLAGRTIGDDRLASIPLPGATPGGSLLAIAVQGMIDDPVDFGLIGQAALEDDASRLADAARGLIAIGRLAAAGDGEHADWIALLDTLRITQSGPFVNLRGSVPVDVLTRLAEGLANGNDRPVAGAEEEGAAGGAPPGGDATTDPGSPGSAETVP